MRDTDSHQLQPEKMERKLFESAVEGSVEKLLELIRQDPLILDRAAINGVSGTPLHVAAMVGHTEFVHEILRRRPQLAKELDSTRSSPLHLACRKGHLEIVRSLLQVDSDMCFAVDEDGRNPLLVAAMNGRIGVLQELVRARPKAARAGADHGGTILHACVKSNQLEALKMLVEAINDVSFMNKRDDFGFTILHLAVSYKQLETVYFLLTRSVEVNALSSNGFTALDILSQSPRDLKDLDIAESLRSAGASRTTAKLIPISVRNRKRDSRKAVPLTYELVNRKRERKASLANKKNAIMVVASLIATMAFSAGLTPPGGLWQENSPLPPPGGLWQDNSPSPGGLWPDNFFTDKPHQAGKSILASEDHFGYNIYILFNTIGFVSSLSVILLLITGLPFKRGFFMWILTLIMWAAITSMTLTYLFSLSFLIPDDWFSVVAGSVLSTGLYSWIGLMGLVVVGHFLYLVYALFRKLFRAFRRKRRQEQTCLPLYANPNMVPV